MEPSYRRSADFYYGHHHDHSRQQSTQRHSRSVEHSSYDSIRQHIHDPHKRKMHDSQHVENNDHNNRRWKRPRVLDPSDKDRGLVDQILQTLSSSRTTSSTSVSSDFKPDFLKDQRLVRSNRELADCAEKGDVTQMHVVLKQMRERKLELDLDSYASCFDTFYNRKGKPEQYLGKQILQLCHDIIDAGLATDALMYGKIIRALVRNDDLLGAFSILERMGHTRTEFHEVAIKACVQAIVRNQEGSLGMQLYTAMKGAGVRLTLNDYQTLIDIHIKMDKIEEALLIFQDMQRANITPSEIIYTMLIDVCSRIENTDIRQLITLLYDMIKEGYTLNSVVHESLNSLIQDLARRDHLDAAFQLFQEMQKLSLDVGPSAKTCEALIQGYKKQNNLEQALFVFHEMRNNGHVPSARIYDNLFELCDQRENLKEALSVFEQMKAEKIQPSEKAYHLLVDMCFRGKQFDKANKIFNSAPFKLNVRQEDLQIENEDLKIELGYESDILNLEGFSVGSACLMFKKYIDKKENRYPFFIITEVVEFVRKGKEPFMMKEALIQFIEINFPNQLEIVDTGSCFVDSSRPLQIEDNELIGELRIGYKAKIES